MKKLFLILGLCLMVFTSFGKQVVVVEVNKAGNGWQNLFNCYNRVTTTFQGCENGVTYASLDCTGAGFNFCRASREIGTSDCSNYSHLLNNQGIINAINVLIDASEKSAKKGTARGSSTQKVAVQNQDKTELYFVKATWNYNSRDMSKATMTITIEVDDSSLINSRRI